LTLAKPCGMNPISTEGRKPMGWRKSKTMSMYYQFRLGASVYMPPRAQRGNNEN
jgi:hypothetical protein